MKNQIKIIIFILILNFFNVYPQLKKLTSDYKDFCTTSTFYNTQNMNILKENENFNKLDIRYTSICVKLYFHVLRSSSVMGGVSVSNVNESFNLLVNDFYNHRIYFNWNGIIDYIDNDNFYLNTSASRNNIMSYNDHYDGVDIYINGDDRDNVNTAYGVGINSSLIMSGGFWQPPYPATSRTHIISHELGHVFGLWHTFHGGIAESPSGADPNECLELVNGSNSSTCGDYVTDTPADPCTVWNIDSSCNWTNFGTQFDPNGQIYNPKTNNNMSYSIPSCMGVFTLKQGVRMRKALVSLPFLQACSRYAYGLVEESVPPHPCSLTPTNFKIYPNPIDNILNFEIEKENFNIDYKIYDAYFNLVLNGTFKNDNTNISTSILQNGNYYIHLYIYGEQIIKTIIINHKN